MLCIMRAVGWVWDKICGTVKQWNSRVAILCNCAIVELGNCVVVRQWNRVTVK